MVAAPLNQYPLWKHLLILGVVMITALYSLPNLYPSMPAIQVSHESGELDAATLPAPETGLAE